MKLTTAAAVFLSISNTSAISIDEKVNLRGVERHSNHEVADVGILHAEPTLSSDSGESGLSCQSFCRLTRPRSEYGTCLSSFCVKSEATATKFIASKEKYWDFKCYDECYYQTTTWADYYDCLYDSCFFGSAEDVDVGMLHADESAQFVATATANSASTEEKVASKEEYFFDLCRDECSSGATDIIEYFSCIHYNCNNLGTQSLVATETEDAGTFKEPTNCIFSCYFNSKSIEEVEECIKTSCLQMATSSGDKSRAQA